MFNVSPLPRTTLPKHVSQRETSAYDVIIAFGAIFQVNSNEIRNQMMLTVNWIWFLRNLWKPQEKKYIFIFEWTQRVFWISVGKCNYIIKTDPVHRKKGVEATVLLNLGNPLFIIVLWFVDIYVDIYNLIE